MSLRTARRLISGSIVLWLLAAQLSAQEPRIAVIIDDVGNQLAAGRRSVALPGPVVLAILPHTPFANTLAEEGAASGKEILVHLPMQASDLTADPGPGALDLSHDFAAINARLSAAIDAVPHATGVSNHMGSLLTRDSVTMRLLMRSLRRYEKFLFVDSYTTHLSVALMTARAENIPALKRDVFIDAEPGSRALERAWNRLLDRARGNGFAIGIAHPRSETLQFLEHRLNDLADVELVSLQELLTENPPQRSYAETIGFAPVGDFMPAERMH